ncbi:MAG: hypothetical protein ACRD44_18735 [Bryobacteraceae bacterium]
MITQECIPALNGAREMPGGNTMRLAHGSLLQQLYGRNEVIEEFWCNYSLNPHYCAALDDGRLRPVAFADNGAWRAVELSNHPFFPGTLFLPQRNSEPGRPHPVLTGLLAAASQHFAEP